MRFYDTEVHVLSPEVAYSVSLRDQVEDGEVRASRVTLIFLRKGNEWKMVHGHFSYPPEWIRVVTSHVLKQLAKIHDRSCLYKL